MYIVKYVSPVYLIVVFAAWVYQQAILPPDEGKLSRIQALFKDGRVQMAIGFMALVVILFMLLVSQAARRWKRLEQAEQGAST